MADESTLKIGDEFNSFKAVEDAVSRFECKEKVSYWKRDSRTIKSMVNRGYKCVASEELRELLKYYDVTYNCVKGGRSYSSKSSGIRPNQRTFREGCTSCVKFKLVKDKLVVHQLDTDHNHPVSEEFFKHLPKSRKLNSEEVEEVSRVIQIKPNKKILQDHIRNYTGKCVTLRDINNIKARLNPEHNDVSDLLSTCTDDSQEVTPGAEFHSFLTLSAAITRWEESNYVCLYRRSSRSIQSHAKRATKKIYNMHLQFAEIDYACIHGGRKLKTSTKGQRPNQSTFLKDCPFTIKVRVTEDGQKLYVKKMGTAKSHNHEICKSTFQLLPKQRRLTESESSEVGKMMEMNANNKQIQQYLLESTGKNVILKDINNIRSRFRTDKRNGLEGLVTEMKKTAGATVDELTSTNDTLQAIAFQTEEMRNTFDTYPELLLIDASYKLKDLKMSLYIVMNVDGNGESEIICLWLVATEDRMTISLLIDKFKERNAKWTDTEIIMADKDMIERDVLPEKLPGVEVQICHFHTMRSFQKDIDTEELDISVEERNTSLKFLLKMSRAKSEEEYQGIYAEFAMSSPRSVVEYFNRDWYDIRKEWVKGLKNIKSNYLNSTNNRLESTDYKIKSMVSRYSGITAFFQDLMYCITTLKTERDHWVSCLLTKATIIRQERSKPELNYKELLTPYAFRCVEEQLDCSFKTKILGTVDDRSATVESKSLGNIGVSVDSCQCSFFNCMLLPCRHVFAVRRCFDLPLYDEVLCAERWTRTYFRDWQQNYYPPEVGPNKCSSVDNTITVKVEPCEKEIAILSEQQKYLEACDLLEKIGLIISEQGTEEFRYNMNMLENLKNHLQLKKKVAITEWVEKEDESSISDPETYPGNVVEISQESANCQIPMVLPEAPSLSPSVVSPLSQIIQPVQSDPRSAQSVTIVLQPVEVQAVPSCSQAVPAGATSIIDVNRKNDLPTNTCTLEVPPEQVKRDRPKGTELPSKKRKKSSS